MKTSTILLVSIVLVAVSVLSSCSRTKPAPLSWPAQRGQRVVKVSFRKQHGSFRLRIDHSPVEKLSNADFTNVMTQLRLDYGDIVIWEAQRDESGKELSHPPDISRWWFHHLEHVRASLYCLNSDEVADFFATPFYHWKAPPAKPRPLQDAMFFVDGVSLGQGSDGFHAMMDMIERTPSGPAFIVAPRIKNEGQASPWIAGDQLRAWAESAGASARFEKIFSGRYGELLDFARFGDE